MFCNPKHHPGFNCFYTSLFLLMFLSTQVYQTQHEGLCVKKQDQALVVVNDGEVHFIIRHEFTSTHRLRPHQPG